MTRLLASLALPAAFAFFAYSAPAIPDLHAQAAQAPLPKFEVASVRRNTTNELGFRRGLQPGGTTFTNAALQQLITAAYNVQPFQIVGGPPWMTTDRFDIVAKLPEGASPDQMNLMLQSLLADRFKLVAHTEQRELPIYTLVKAREDGKLGSALKPAAVDCGPSGRGRGGPPPPGPGGPGAAPAAGLPCRALMAPGRLTAAGQPVEQLARMLAPQLGRPVYDKTGLTGSYDFELVFMPEGGRGMPIGPPPPGAPPLPPVDPDAPSLFTAIQEQLGLKLEAGRGPVDVIVIDSVQPPTED